MKRRVYLERFAFDAPVYAADTSAGAVYDGFGADDAALEVDARIRYLRGGEAVIAGRLAGRQAAVISVPRTPETEAITTEWRARDLVRGTAFALRAIVMTDDRRELEITAEGGGVIP